MNDAITGMLNGFVPQNGTYKKGEHNVKLRNNKTVETAFLTTGSNIMGEKGEVKIFNKAGEQSRMLSLKPAGDQYIATLRNNETNAMTLANMNLKGDRLTVNSYSGACYKEGLEPDTFKKILKVKGLNEGMSELRKLFKVLCTVVR